MKIGALIFYFAWWTESLYQTGNSCWKHHKMQHQKHFFSQTTNLPTQTETAIPIEIVFSSQLEMKTKRAKS